MQEQNQVHIREYGGILAEPEKRVLHLYSAIRNGLKLYKAEPIKNAGTL
jgi:hypothetical protein